MIFTNGMKIGVQRKEVTDLLQSIHDGRLAKEVGQMQGLHRSMVVIEGNMSWTIDGMLVTNGYGYEWSWKQHHGLMWSLMQRGVWVDYTRSLSETIDLVRAFEAWNAKPRHQSLSRRPTPQGVWGKPSNKEYACHVVMGIPGVGPELAERIVDAFGIPFVWKVTMADLMSIKGIGKEKAMKIWKALEEVPDE